MRNHYFSVLIVCVFLTLSAHANEKKMCHPPMSHDYCQSHGQKVSVLKTESKKAISLPKGKHKKKTSWWRKQWKAAVNKASDFKKKVIQKIKSHKKLAVVFNSIFSDKSGVEPKTVKEVSVAEKKKRLPVYNTKKERLGQEASLGQLYDLITRQKEIKRIKVPQFKKEIAKLPSFQFLESRYKNLKPLISPVIPFDKLDKITQQKPHFEEVKYGLPEQLKVAKKLSYSEVMGLRVPDEKAMSLKLVDVPLIREEDVKHLIGQIFKKKKKCHLAIGLLHKNSSESVDCLFDMGLYSEGISRLGKVISSKTSARDLNKLSVWLEKAPKPYWEVFGKKLSQISKVNYKSKKAQDAGYYYQALYYLGQKKFKKATYLAEKVSEKSQHAIGAMLIQSVLKEKFKRVDRRLIKKAFSGEFSKKERGIVLNAAAGLKFRQEKYKEAIRFLKQINKDDHNWVDALLQMGWAQLLSQDYLGAIGNMYSLHTPIFQNVYKPDSYVIRTIGYINICQYGDAYKTLSQLENKYRPWLSRINTEIKKNRPSLDFYSYFERFVKLESAAHYGSLPHEVVRELVRQKDVINLKKKLLRLEKEKKQYDFIDKINKKEVAAEFERSRKSIVDKKGKVIKKIPRGGVYAERLKVVRAATKSFNQLSGARRQLLLKEIALREKEVGFKMKAHLAEVKTNLERVLENNEFLRFEVFSESGENLRSLQKGMVAKRRIHHSVKPKNKELHWNVSDEVWMDEIGHYRSSLKNNCAKNKVTASK